MLRNLWKKTLNEEEKVRKDNNMAKRELLYEIGLLETEMKNKAGEYRKMLHEFLIKEVNS